MIQSNSYPYDNKSPTCYDYVFIGLGASNSLLLLSLIKAGFTAAKKIAIVEAEHKDINDKTYCFWASPDDLMVKELNPIISHHYQELSINKSDVQDISRQPYYYIKSIDLYQHTLNFANSNAIPIFRSTVFDISVNEGMNTIHTSEQTINSNYVFDSRPPVLNKLPDEESYIHQSFYGLKIKCEKKILCERSFEMMNFEIEQHDFTQFLYVLPFSSNECLIELTRFGSEKIERNYAHTLLKEKIQKDFGNFEVISEESGCIPMTTFINPPNILKGVLNTGASANLIKPSTGYGFKKMYAFAEIVSEKLSAENHQSFNRIALPSKRRFRFYDALLLIILSKWPYEGKKIFTKLFKSHSIFTIFTFLDEKTSLKEEVKIFYSLPLLPFLKALAVYSVKKKSIYYILAFIAVLVYHFVNQLSPAIAMSMGYGLIIVGLFTVGIPHGAVDHLLLKNKKTSILNFVIRYLLLVIGYFVLWYYFPLPSLIIFILYSAFHFGESELIEVAAPFSTFKNYFKAFILGLSILAYIIFTHLHETTMILSSIEPIALQINQLEIHLTPYKTILAVSALSYSLYLYIKTRKKGYARLLFMLLLGTQLPLIFAFSVYFICQHSVNSWRHIHTRLHMSSISLYKKALPFTLGALGIFILIVINRSIVSYSLESLWGSFFIFLACISFPHILLMNSFYKKTN